MEKTWGMLNVVPIIYKFNMWQTSFSIIKFNYFDNIFINLKNIFIIHRGQENYFVL